MDADATSGTLSANEAACVTGVPLKRVHRIIDIGLLGRAAERRAGSRTVFRDGLVCIRLAHETTDTLTLDGRRRLVRYLLDNPEAKAAHDSNLSVDVRSIREDVRRGLSRLARARRTMSTNEAVLSGTPCIKGTRIPAHDIAEMLANGDSVDRIVEAYPVLTEEQIEAASLYARAYPRRGRPRRRAEWRSEAPVASRTFDLAELSPPR